jgi:hypothetical protein
MIQREMGLLKELQIAIIVAVLLSVFVIIVPLFLNQRHPQPHPVEEAMRNLQILKLLENQYFAENGRYAPDPDGTSYYKVGNTDMQNALPDFRPGPPDKKSFEYKITSSDKGVKFTAYATGKAGTVVGGKSFSLNHNSRYPEEIVITKGKQNDK